MRPGSESRQTRDLPVDGKKLVIMLPINNVGGVGTKNTFKEIQVLMQSSDF